MQTEWTRYNGAYISVFRQAGNLPGKHQLRTDGGQNVYTDGGWNLSWALLRLAAMLVVTFKRRVASTSAAVNSHAPCTAYGKHGLYKDTQAGFPPEGNARNELTNLRNLRNYARNAMTSLSDRPITAASDDGVCRWHAAKLRHTRAK